MDHTSQTDKLINVNHGQINLWNEYDTCDKYISLQNFSIKLLRYYWINWYLYDYN